MDGEAFQGCSFDVLAGLGLKRKRHGNGLLLGNFFLAMRSLHQPMSIDASFIILGAVGQPLEAYFKLQKNIKISHSMRIEIHNLNRWM